MTEVVNLQAPPEHLALTLTPADPLAMPEVLRAAMPDKDDAYRKAFVLGALATLKRRASPPTAMPEAYDIPINHPEASKDEKGYWNEIDIPDLPYLSRPIVAHIHQDPPDVVVAADRGGRLFGMGVFKAWQRCYPETPFPTIDHQLHFARLSRSVDSEGQQALLKAVLYRSGAIAELLVRQQEGDPRKVSMLLLEDWVNSGDTILTVRDELKTTLQTLGFKPDAVEFRVATMIKDQLVSVPHIVADPARYDCWATWNNLGEHAGVTFTGASNPYRDGHIPHSLGSPVARRLRRELGREMRAQVPLSPQYRERFVQRVTSVAEPAPAPQEMVRSSAAGRPADLSLKERLRNRISSLIPPLHIRRRPR